MDSGTRRRIIGLVLATTGALTGVGWLTAEHVSGIAPQRPEQIASVRRLETTPRPTTTTTAPTTTTTPAPATTVPAPTTTTTNAPATTTTRAPAAAVTTVAPAGGWGNLGQSVEQQMLAMVNSKRASGATCGGTAYPPVPPLSLDTTIVTASDAYATDMATYSYFSHTGRDGSDPGQRLARAGYRWSAWAENVAVGQSTPEAAVAGWFGSTGHCTNFMHPAMTHVGFGKAENPSSGTRYYWVADLARPA